MPSIILTDLVRNEHSFSSSVFSFLRLVLTTSIITENQIARAEAMYIANTDNQYLVPTSGKPLRGLIQDHVVAGVWMTNRDTFFTREDYFQLLYGALKPEEDLTHYSGRLVTLPPTIFKPRPLWTGKQIVSSRFPFCIV
jgi:DNA-directed RNA polymerase I subunit RPA1